MSTSDTRRIRVRSRLAKGITIPVGIYTLFTRPASLTSPAARPRRAAILMLGELLPWVIVMGACALSVVRGALYGVVDPGPYDHSWGGPTLAGAWLAHFGIGIVVLCLAALAPIGLGALRERLELPAHGVKAPRWAATVENAPFGPAAKRSSVRSR